MLGAVVMLALGFICLLVGAMSNDAERSRSGGNSPGGVVFMGAGVVCLLLCLAALSGGK